MAASTRTVQNLLEKISKLPEDRIAEVEDFVDFLNLRTQKQAATLKANQHEFPVISVGKWPNNLDLSREALYGDDGR